MFFDGLLKLLSKLLFLTGRIDNRTAFEKPLSESEERETFEKIKLGDKLAEEKLIKHNLRLVAHITKKYKSSNIDNEDLISIGTIGLMKAIKTFKYDKGNSFSTYASRCIENEILMFLRLAKKYKNDVSLYDPIGTDRDGNEIVMLDVINSNTPDFAEQLDFSIQSNKILEAIHQKLTEQERTVVILRYGLWNHDIFTQQEIASKLGISRSYVSRIEKKALKKLRVVLET